MKKEKETTMYDMLFPSVLKFDEYTRDDYYGIAIGAIAFVLVILFFLYIGNW